MLIGVSSAITTFMSAVDSTSDSMKPTWVIAVQSAVAVATVIREVLLDVPPEEAENNPLNSFLRIHF